MTLSSEMVSSSAAASASPGELAEALVGPHFGVIEHLARMPVESDDVPLAVYAARLANTAAFSTIEVPRQASGAALDALTAIGACIGEAVERYCAALGRPGLIHRAKAIELFDPVVGPDVFALFSRRQYWQPRRQFPFSRWRATDRIGWVKAHSLSESRDKWVPAVFVLQPYEPLPHERLLAPSHSTGLACAKKWSDAVSAGLCEVIERDAVALAWLGQVPPSKLTFSSGCSAETNRIIESLDELRLRWGVFDLSTDLGLPVYAALLEGHSSVGRIIAFGSACHPDADLAVRKALIEASHCRMYVKSILRRRPGWRAGRRFQNVASFEDHARFYSSHPEHRRALDRWWNTPFSRPWTRPSCPVPLGWLETQVHHLGTKGYEVLAVDLTTADVRELGLRVGRVLVPGLQPLHGDHRWPHLGGSRLNSLSLVFGAKTCRPWRWNPYPHPCP